MLELQELLVVVAAAVVKCQLLGQAAAGGVAVVNYRRLRLRNVRRNQFQVGPTL